MHDTTATLPSTAECSSGMFGYRPIHPRVLNSNVPRIAYTESNPATTKWFCVLTASWTTGNTPGVGLCNLINNKINIYFVRIVFILKRVVVVRIAESFRASLASFAKWLQCSFIVYSIRRDRERRVLSYGMTRCTNLCSLINARDWWRSI